MRLILILLFSLGGSLALAVDPTLVRQSFGKCYYDDGSVISSNTCPSRLRLNAGRSENPYKINGMTEDSRDFYRDFMEKRNLGQQRGMSAAQFAIEMRRIELAKEKENQKRSASSQPSQISQQLVICKLTSNGAEFAALTCPAGSSYVR
jgi:hypothetical protein